MNVFLHVFLEQLNVFDTTTAHPPHKPHHTHTPEEEESEEGRVHPRHTQFINLICNQVFYLGRVKPVREHRTA